MEADPRSQVKRADVLRKLNNESLAAIERGLLGDIPFRLRPQRPTTLDVPGRHLQLERAKPTGLLSSCLPIAETTPESSSTLQESPSPLKKTFSFRDRLARINIFGKEKSEKQKLKEEPLHDLDSHVTRTSSEPVDLMKFQGESKASKKFWFFRNKEQTEKKELPWPTSPVKDPRWYRKQKTTSLYVRSKSFEFLPRALEEDRPESKKTLKRNRHSYIFGSHDSMGDAWTSNDSLHFVVPKANDDEVFEKSQSSASGNTSTASSSARVDAIFERESVQDLLDEFERAVELFQDENYLSDGELYKQGRDRLPALVIGDRKSSSFSALPSPRIVKTITSRPDGATETFRRELASVLSAKRTARGFSGPGTARRGSVTDWCVIDEAKATPRSIAEVQRRTKKRPTNRVRRVSSTKYWISNEESLLYAQEKQRPPFIIPRITSYRACRAAAAPAPAPPARLPPLFYAEDSLSEATEVPLQAQVKVKDARGGWGGGVGDWSPLSERGRMELERAFGRHDDGGASLVRLTKRLGGSNDNLLAPRRPPNPSYADAQHSSGDSLDLEYRALRTDGRHRKSKSMIPRRAAKSPVPATRHAAHSDSADGHIFGSYVKRTKFSENGKKSRKNWTENYLVLTPTHLLFYKDAKAYQTAMTKGAGAPPSPNGPRGAELSLPLKGAAVERCTQQHTSRYTRSIVVSAGQDQLLIQDVSPAGAAYWYESIDKAISRHQPVDFLCLPAPTPEPLSSPAASRRNKNYKVGDSSNEDLSDSTDHTKVRNKLRKFFTRRPTMEVLIKKGIYKDEPVFGRNLDEVCPESSPRVPEFVTRCVNKIESCVSNMHTDGLYRASGNLSQVQKIRLEIDQNNLDIVEHSNDVHVLTGSLKLFFRELKEPLIPCKLFNRILAATGIKSRDARIKEFREIVSSLPQCNWDTLKFILEHLLRVTECAAQNRMHVANMAIVFGPTLLWAPAELAHNIAIDCIQQNHAIEILLTDFQHIFSNTRPKKKS